MPLVEYAKKNKKEFKESPKHLFINLFIYSFFFSYTNFGLYRKRRHLGPPRQPPSCPRLAPSLPHGSHRPGVFRCARSLWTTGPAGQLGLLLNGSRLLLCARTLGSVEVGAPAPTVENFAGALDRFPLAADRSALWSSGPRVSAFTYIATDGENSAAMTGNVAQLCSTTSPGV
jgi:hypothetical protein